MVRLETQTTASSTSKPGLVTFIKEDGDRACQIHITTGENAPSLLFAAQRRVHSPPAWLAYSQTPHLRADGKIQTAPLTKTAIIR